MIRLANAGMILLCMALQAILAFGRPMSGKGVERFAARVSDVFNDVDHDDYRHWAEHGTYKGLGAYPTEDSRPSRPSQRGMHDPYQGWTRPDQPAEAYPERHGHAAYLGQYAQQPDWSRPSHRAQGSGQPRPDARGWSTPSGSRSQPGQRAPLSNSRNEGGVSSKMLYYASATQVKFDQGRGPSLPSRPSIAEPLTSRRAPIPGSDGATSSRAGEAGGSSSTGGAAGGSSSTTPRFHPPPRSHSSARRVPSTEWSAMGGAQPRELVRENIDTLPLPPGFENIATMGNDVFNDKIKQLTKADLLRVAFELFRARTSMPRMDERVTVGDERDNESSYRSLKYVYPSPKQRSLFLEIVKRMINAYPTEEWITATLTINPRSNVVLARSFLENRVRKIRRYVPPERPPFYGGVRQAARLYSFVLGDYEVYISDKKSTLDSDEVLYSAFAVPKGLVQTGTFKDFRLDSPFAYGIMFGYLEFPKKPKVTSTFLFEAKGADMSVPAPPRHHNKLDSSRKRIAQKLGI